jgi:hypothetical protein
MATITSAASGNWSNTATWVGGVVPGVADDAVIGAGHTVTADVDFTVLTLRGATDATANIVITNSRTITCTATFGIASKNLNSGGSLININGVGITVNIYSNILGNSAFSQNGTRAISVNAVCTCNIYGNLSASSSTTSNSNEVILISANAVVNLLGNVEINASTTTGRISGFNCNSNCTLNITGNLVGTLGSGNNNPVRAEAAACTINVTGNITANNSVAISSNQLTTINIVGNILAGTQPAINNFGSGVLIINGTVTASNASAAIISASTSAINVVNGLIFNTNGFNALYCIKILLGANTTSWMFQQYLSSNKTLYTPGVDLGNPVVTDVRTGVSYASGALTGTLDVPPASSVAVGVPVDNTTGTAIISISDMGALLASYSV